MGKMQCLLGYPALEISRESYLHVRPKGQDRAVEGVED